VTIEHALLVDTVVQVDDAVAEADDGADARGGSGRKSTGLLQALEQIVRSPWCRQAEP
jgi:hypothetical protein